MENYYIRCKFCYTMERLPLSAAQEITIGKLELGYISKTPQQRGTSDNGLNCLTVF